MTKEHTDYLHHAVVNQDLESLGTVTDVLYAGADNAEPSWFVVKPGMLRAERLVPVERSYETADGTIVVPFHKRWVTSAPKAGDHVLTADLARAAADHYDIAR